MDGNSIHSKLFRYIKLYGSGSFGHGVIAHSHLQQLKIFHCLSAVNDSCPIELITQIIQACNLNIFTEINI